MNEQLRVLSAIDWYAANLNIDLQNLACGTNRLRAVVVALLSAGTTARDDHCDQQSRTMLPVSFPTGSGRRNPKSSLAILHRAGVERT